MPDGIYGDDKLVAGAYCNGGLLPLVGGELARAAFDHGFEEYGVAQLLKYEQLTANNETYLWYFPDGRKSTVETSTSPDASPTDGWGSSAMLYALFEGLAGIVDEGKLFQSVRLSPRWLAAGRSEASVCVTYGASGASFGTVLNTMHPPKLLNQDNGKSRNASSRPSPPGNKIDASYSRDKKTEVSQYKDGRKFLC